LIKTDSSYRLLMA